ncbi:hypothetical protein GGS23DRAFT_431035 [Durotheca rogersii]|uniref:uncharacterized protein n=1 Tax=Durotheca rogersii TaxID=419775 RepID=UPI0022202D6F|nr:uncharacterized protein GGS23DRAFT_431035 [Durotheca rogersii]KAI5865517.1 hypothetical protein GGS23DRAFT_431035 [Durotheca rogersii]
MAGRRLRAISNSTVATIDDAAIQYCTEDSLLKPVPPTIHSDHWPCFLLVDATIYHKNGTIANQLHVELEGPFIIRGRVEIEKDQDEFLVNRNIKSRSVWIQIQNSMTFAIGMNNAPVLWAGGVAGWYEIVPSDAYKATCDIMFQGITLFFALDQYDETPKTGRGNGKKSKHKTRADPALPLDDMLFQYAVTVGDGITLPEAYDRLKSQSIFLLSHFPKGTRFYAWLTSEFPKNAQKFVAKDSDDLKAARTLDPSPLTAVPYSSLGKSNSFEVAVRKRKDKASLTGTALRNLRNSATADPEVIDISSDEPQSRGTKAPKTKNKSSINTRSDSVKSTDATMLDVPDDTAYYNVASTHHLGGARPPPNAAAKVDTTQSNFQGGKRSDSRGISALLEALQYLRNDMLEKVKKGTQKKQPDHVTPKGWFNNLYFQMSTKSPAAVPELCQYYARDLARLLGPEWHKSNFYLWVKERVDTPPTFDLITEEDMKTVRRRHQKAKPTRDETSATIEEQQRSASSGGKQPQRGRAGGKVAGLRPPTGSKKRLRQEASFDEDEMELDEDGSLKTSKRSRYSADDDRGEEEGDETSTVSDAEEEEEPTARVVTRAENLPSTTPTGPNQTWTCGEPDCDYVVRAANQEEGQALIAQHHEEHEKAAQDEAKQAALSRANLALKESQGYMPINNLLAKIRSLGDKTERRNEVRLNGQTLPQPIKRGLLI